MTASRRREALAWFAACALLALYTAALFAPLLAHLLHGGPARWLEGDVAEEYWPDLVHLCRTLHDGRVPRWNPYEHGGAPFAADPQTGVYHPVNWALCALAGPSPSVHWADFRVALHFFLGSAFMARFLRGEGAGWPAALVGAALFPLTPYLRHNWELNLTWAFAYLPWVLYELRALARAPSARRGVWLGVALALAALVGSPPSLFYLVLVGAVFGVYCAAEALRAGASWRALAGALAAGAAVCAGLVAPMLAATSELTALSVRSDPTFAAMAEGGLKPNNVFGALLPALNDHFYVGLLALVLAALAVAGPRPYRARWVWLALAAAGAALMLGAHAPLFRVVYALVPGAKLFRNPTRYTALYGTALAVLAAMGLDGYLRAPTKRAAVAVGGAAVGMFALSRVPGIDPWTHGAGLARAGLAALAGGLALAAWGTIVQRSKSIPSPSPGAAGDERAPPPPTLPPGSGAGGELHGRGFSAGPRPFPQPWGKGRGWGLRGSGWGTYAVALVVGAALAWDLFAYLPPARHTRPGPVAEGRAAYARWRALSGADPAWRVYDEFAVGMRAGSRYGLREFRGYQDPMSLSRYQKAVGALMETPALLAVYNVRWVLYGRHYLHGDGHHLLPDPAGAPWALARGGGVYEVRDPLPVAFWMDGADVTADADAALVRAQERAPRPVVALEAASVRGEAVAPGTGRFVAARATVTDDVVTAVVDAPAPGWMVVNEAWFPGWVATVNGRPAGVVRANALVRAVRVGAGRQRVVMRYRPWRPRVFEPVALATLAAACAVLARRKG